MSGHSFFVRRVQRLSLRCLLPALAFLAAPAAAENLAYPGATLATSPFGEGSSLFSSTSLNNNTVTVDSGAVSYAYGGVTNSAQDVSGNALILNGGSVYLPFGGRSASGNVSDNSVTVNGTASVGGDSYAAYSVSGNVTGNTVTVNSGYAGRWAIGGWSQGGDAVGNAAIVSGGSVGHNLYGGSTHSGSATGNTVLVSGGTVGMHVYGGEAYTGNNGDATNNTVTITGGAVYTVYTGYSLAGKIANNTFTITGGSAGIVYGGISPSSGEATGNAVIINGGTVSQAHGGNSQDGKTTDNTVTVKKGTANDIYGGYSNNSGDATGNVVTIEGGAIGQACGGYSKTGKATGNTVIARGGTIGRDIFGGYSAGAATGNTVILSGNASVPSSYSVYAGFSTGSADAFTDNTIRLEGYTGTLAYFGNAENLVFGIPAAKGAGDTVLTVNNNALLAGPGGAVSTIGLYRESGAVALQTGDVITLISANNTLPVIAPHTVQTPYGEQFTVQTDGKKLTATYIDWVPNVVTFDATNSNFHLDSTTTVSGGTLPGVTLNCSPAATGTGPWSVSTGAGCTLSLDSGSEVVPSGYTASGVTYVLDGIDLANDTFTPSATSHTVTIKRLLTADEQTITVSGNVFNPATGGTLPTVGLDCGTGTVVVGSYPNFTVPTGASCTITVSGAVAPSGYTLGTTTYGGTGINATTGAFTVPAGGISDVTVTTALTANAQTITASSVFNPAVTSGTVPEVAVTCTPQSATPVSPGTSWTAPTGASCTVSASGGVAPSGYTLGTTTFTINGTASTAFIVPASGTTAIAATTALLSVPTIVTANRLNDTWQTDCSEGWLPIACSDTVYGDTGAYPRQDARFGRDAAFVKGVLTKIGSGPAGYDLTRICNDGSNCDGQSATGTGATDWACTRDNVTGLLWFAGVEPGSAMTWNDAASTAAGSPIANANAGAGRCGATDWRMPTRRELMSIKDDSEAIYSYLPRPMGLWAAESAAGDPASAWGLEFHYNYGSGTSDKTLSSNLRLVSGAPLPEVDLVGNFDGTVSDRSTALMWDQCLWGASGASCSTGSASAPYWTDPGTSTSVALKVAVTANAAAHLGYRDWRLPNRNEMESLFDLNAASAIDPVLFPNAAGATYWTNTHSYGTRVWKFDSNGHAYSQAYQDAPGHVRLVRGGNVYDALALNVTVGITPATTDAQIAFGNATATAGDIYWTVRPASSAAPNFVDLEVSANRLGIAAAGSASATASSLSAGTPHVLYYFTKTTGGLYGPLQSLPFTTLGTPAAQPIVISSNVFNPATGGTLPTIDLDCGTGTVVGGSYPNFTVPTGASCTITVNGAVAPAGYALGTTTYGGTGVNATTGAFTVPAGGISDVTVTTALTANAQTITVSSNTFNPTGIGGTLPTIDLDCGTGTVVGGIYPNFTVPTGASCTITVNGAVAPAGYTLGTTTYGGTGVNATTGAFTVPAGGINDVTVTTALTANAQTITASSVFNPAVTSGTVPEVAVTCTPQPATPVSAGTSWTAPTGTSCTVSASGGVAPTGHTLGTTTFTINGTAGTAFIVPASGTTAIAATTALVAVATSTVTFSTTGNAFYQGSTAVSGGTLPGVTLSCSPTATGTGPWSVSTGAGCTLSLDTSGEVVPAGYAASGVTYVLDGIDLAGNTFTVTAASHTVTIKRQLTANPQSVTHVVMSSAFVDASGTPIPGGTLPTIVLNCPGMTGSHPSWTVPAGTACTLSLDTSSAVLPSGYTVGNARFLLNGTLLPGNSFTVQAGNNNIAFQYVLLFGASGVPIPALDGKALALLVLLLGSCGVALRRRGWR